MHNLKKNITTAVFFIDVIVGQNLSAYCHTSFNCNF